MHHAGSRSRLRRIAGNNAGCLIVLVILLSPLLIAGVRWILYGDGSIVLSAKDIRIVDGDTIDAAGARWRLVGFDTPEVRPLAKCEEEHARGLIASARLAELIAGGARIHPTRRSSDKYKRRLGRLKVGGRDVADILIAEGLAKPFDGRGRRPNWCR